MSILKKITILFIICCSLVLFIGIYANSINEKKSDSLNKNRFLEIAKELILSINDSRKLEKIHKKYHLKKIKPLELDNKYTIIYDKRHSFGYIKILKNSSKIFLEIKYLEETLLFVETNPELLKDTDILKILTLFNILVLILMFIYIVNLLSPLKKISEEIKKFATGSFHTRIEIDTTKEIALLGESFNMMAEKVEDLIVTREELLRNIGHELKTPISKGKFVLEKMPDNEEKEYIKKIFTDIDILTTELIELEKLRSTSLKKETFEVETLITEALGKLYINEEEKINITIKSNFKLYADLYYLSIALKNLVDNGLKYSTQIPIKIVVHQNKIVILNKGEKLEHDLGHYTKPFVQGSTNNESKGFGLGLSIVDKILNKHEYKLGYRHLHQYNLFTISMKK